MALLYRFQQRGAQNGMSSDNDIWRLGSRSLGFLIHGVMAVFWFFVYCMLLIFRVDEAGAYGGGKSET